LDLIVGSHHHWTRRIEKYGLDEAILMSKAENSHPQLLMDIVRKYNIDCDIQQLNTVDAYYDLEAFQRAKSAINEITQYINVPYQIYSAEKAQKELRLSKACIGAIEYPAGKLWPYKLVSQLSRYLLNNGINFQMETPVTKIISEDGKWRLETPRGNILTSTVVHATNGYIGHLLPFFSRIIEPTRGHMTAQIPPQSLSLPPLKHTYSFMYKDGKFDYLIQLPNHSGNKLMFGGGYYEDPQPNENNDAELSQICVEYLQNQLPKVFQWEGELNPEKRVDMIWSGIMGFSQDGIPWVGQLLDEFGGGHGQWICAGYTGEGSLYFYIF
jgi:glycine/D-amino acid oxidase-like deaminating enzyme